jgi:hypothetical protein
MRQTLTLNYPADRAQTRQRRNLPSLELPTDRLSTAKESLVVKMQTRQFDCFDNLYRYLPRIALRSARFILFPIMSFATRLISRNPFVYPGPRVTQLLRDRRDRFALQVGLNRMISVALSFLFHAFLQKEKGADNQTSSSQSLKLIVLFQRTVNDVMAHRRVNDVVTLVT